MNAVRSLGRTIAAVLAFAPLAWATDLHVPGNFNTIQEAIDAATPADLILVTPGSYPEALTVDGKTVTMVRSGGIGLVSVTPPTNSPALRAINGAQVQAAGFAFQGGPGAGATPSADGQRGGDGVISNASTVVLADSTIQGGKGGDGSTQFISMGGNGGHGLLIQSGALAVTSGVESTPGVGGFMGGTAGQILLSQGASNYVFDPSKMANFLLGLATVNNLESLGADNNGDGGVDVADLVRMVNFAGSLLTF